MLTIERSLNVYATGIPQIINLSQYDDDFQLVFSLYTSEGVFTVPSGTTAEIMGTKVDGNGYSADATVSGNTVTVTGNVQMTACAGLNIFEIVLTNNSKRLATINFILQVERAALDADTIQSETVLRELNAIIDGADRAEDAAERAEEAEAVVTESLDKKAPVIINTSDEAEVVTFADGADDMPLKALRLNILPHQSGSGDPSPSNIRPISGYDAVNVTKTGKNLLQVTAATNTVSGVTFTVNDDSSITANGTATATINFNIHPTGNIYFKAGTYTLSGCPSGISGIDIREIYSTGERDTGNGVTREYTEGQIHRYAIHVETGVTLNNVTFRPMVRLASISDPTFEPYQSDTYPVTLPQTVYGGTLDVVSGVLKVTHGIVDLGALTWSYPDSGTAHARFQAPLPTAEPPISGTSIPDMICEKMAVTSTTDVYNHTGDNIIAFHLTQRNLWAYASAYSSASNFKSAMNGVHLAYKLATPTEITLDPTTIKTLLGTNVIWMSADGTLQADYCADTKMYIDALTAPDDDMIANANIQSGKYFTVNNKLYISTSAIAQGEAIVVGTNCTQTDLATALNALNA